MGNRTSMVLKKQHQLGSNIYHQIIASTGTHIKVIRLRESAFNNSGTADGRPSFSTSFEIHSKEIVTKGNLICN